MAKSFSLIPSGAFQNNFLGLASSMLRSATERINKKEASLNAVNDDAYIRKAAFISNDPTLSTDEKTCRLDECEEKHFNNMKRNPKFIFHERLREYGFAAVVSAACAGGAYFIERKYSSVHA